MDITPIFPLKCCDKCKSIRPYTSTQRLYGDTEIVSQEIIVGCEHEQECEAIHNMLKEQMESNKIRMFVDGTGKITQLNQQKKGHWQPYKYGDDTWHQCSACGVADRYISIVKRDGYPDERIKSKRNFCPNCGADMREDGEQDA